MAVTGVRAGEILALRWQDIDWLTGMVTVRDSLWNGIPDLEQLEFARVENRPLVPFDRHFLVLSAEGHEHTGIAFAAARKYAIGELIQVLLLVHGALAPGEMLNHIEFL